MLRLCLIGMVLLISVADGEPGFAGPPGIEAQPPQEKAPETSAGSNGRDASPRSSKREDKPVEGQQPQAKGDRGLRKETEVESALRPLFFADGGLEEQVARLASGDGPLADAAKTLREGKVEDAEASIRAAVASAPAEGNAWHLFLLAEARRRRGDKEGARKALHQAAEQKGAEARVKLWAWNALRELGEVPDEATGRQVLGVVFEVPQPRGLDLLAVFADGSGRYKNQTGHMEFWDTPSQELRRRIQAVLKEAQPLVARDPAQRRRDEPVPADRVRFTLLTCKGNRVAEVNRRATGDLEPLFRAGAMVLQLITQQRTGIR